MSCKTNNPVLPEISIALIFLKDGRIASSFEDNKIRISDFNFQRPTFNNSLILDAHTDMVKTLIELNSNKLASGSCDTNNQIIIWDLLSLNKLYTLNGHSDCVNILISINKDNNDLLISGSSDSTIKIWNGSSQIKELKDHNSSVNTLAYSFRLEFHF